MKNYRKSDYALNKYSENIVYRFADGIQEISMEMFLKENPQKTAEDFWLLKKESDRIFLEQDRMECRLGKKTMSLSMPAELHSSSVSDEQVAPEEQVIEEELLLRTRETLQTAKELLSETQARRFYMYVFQDMTFREIGKLEGTSHQAVAKSVQQAIIKLKIYFEEG